MIWTDFEHQMWSLLKASGFENQSSFLIAVSGGLDSMVLLQLMLRLKPKARIRVAHFHHGPSVDAAQEKYRDQVLEFVKHKISNLNCTTVSFHFERSEKSLKSEAQMRHARWAFLNTIRLANEPLLTGHHLDDWVETALLKMLRGTSLDGISNFKVWNENIFRPFLKVQKSELQKYSDKHKIEFLDDPSNQSEDYFRNWIREKWLKDLETRQSGSYANLSRSLLQMIEAHNNSSTFGLKYFSDDESHGLDRAWFLSLSSADQLKALALFLKNNHIHEFTRGQLEEIKKRLDKNQKDLTFELFERKWVINAMQIMLQ